MRPVSPVSLQPGAPIGPYVIVAPLGAGGMGEVHRARDSRLRREVALKILPPGFSADPSRRTRFEQEAHAAAALNHPNILAVYDVGSDGDVAYLATELVNGETLAALMDRGPLPLRTVLDVAVQIADGLAAAHAGRIVHRDLKPANIMVTNDGRVKILDFGLARQHAPASEETIAGGQTTPGMIVGTVHYMSPEQARGTVVDIRSDQFSFGLILYELLAGKKAFDEPESVQTLSAIITKDPPPLEARTPAPVRWIVDRCLAKSPESRYESTRDLFHELRSVRDHLSEISSQAQPAAAAAPSSGRPARIWPVIAAGLLGLAVPTAFFITAAGPAAPDPSRFQYTPLAFEPGGQSTTAAFSNDGRAVAYAARETSSAPYQVHVRYLDQPTARQLTMVEESAHAIGWSPDDTRVIFATLTAVWSIPTAGGDPQRLLALPASSRVPLGVTVSRDNTTAAVLHGGDDGLWQVSTASLPDGHLVRYPGESFETRNIYNTPTLTFSPDGRQLLLLLNRGTAGEEGWVLSYPAPGASGVRRIEPPLVSYAGTPVAMWMPDNRRVVMSLKPTRLNRRQLWFVDTQSGERQPITTGTRDTSVAAVAPGGDRLLLRESSSDFDVISVDLASGAATPLIASERNEQMPHWSAGERRLVYVANHSGAPEVWLRQEGVADQPLVTARNFPGDTTSALLLPTLAPRGDRVIYSRADTDGQIWLWISSVAGGAPIRATSEKADGRAEFPGAWSPDGSWFAYVAVVGGRPQLMKVRTTGQSTPELIGANPTAGTFVPEWSPTGEWIVWGESLISPDGKTQRSIGTHGSPYYVFSRDGRELYGIRSEQGRHTLFAISVATGRVRDLGLPTTFAPLGTLTPSIRLSVAPDGKTLVYGTGVNRSALWLLDGFNPPQGLAARLGWRR
jgi:serine/threonine protein kinase/Tol biopolymer transport system component